MALRLLRAEDSTCTRLHMRSPSIFDRQRKGLKILYLVLHNNAILSLKPGCLRLDAGIV
jgi:hypothetical protein